VLGRVRSCRRSGQSPRCWRWFLRPGRGSGRGRDRFRERHRTRRDHTAHHKGERARECRGTARAPDSERRGARTKRRTLHETAEFRHDLGTPTNRLGREPLAQLACTRGPGRGSYRAPSSCWGSPSQARGPGPGAFDEESQIVPGQPLRRCASGSELPLRSSANVRQVSYPEAYDNRVGPGFESRSISL
jgi:hypothetical protein